MVNYVNVISSEFDNLKRRVLKVLRYGLNDVRTADDVSPFGLDSNPTPKLIAVYAPTNETGENVIIGYIQEKQLADVGEFRTFSTDANGNLKMYTWLKKDGTLELGGNKNNLATFQGMKDGFDQLKDDVNDMKQKWNAFVLAYVPGGPSSVGLPPAAQQSTESTASIDSSKIDEIKTL